MKKKIRYQLTLLEIMIVIFLIGLIGSVIGVNMKGSLDEGKAFKSSQGANQIKDILLLEVAKGNSVEYVVTNHEAVLQNSGMLKNVRAALKDGWGEPFEIRANGNEILVRSARLATYNRAKRSRLPRNQAPQAQEDHEDEETPS